MDKVKKINEELYFLRRKHIDLNEKYGKSAKICMGISLSILLALNLVILKNYWLAMSGLLSAILLTTFSFYFLIKDTYLEDKIEKLNRKRNLLAQEEKEEEIEKTAE